MPSAETFTLGRGFGQTFDGADPWHRCYMTRKAVNELVRIATDEQASERHFFGLTEHVVDPPHLYSVVHGIQEIPSQTCSRYGVTTAGRDVHRVRRVMTAASRGLGPYTYLHLHPGCRDGEGNPAIDPVPSATDTFTFWNHDALSGSPSMFLIAQYGIPAAQVAGQLAAWCYSGGVISRTGWRILE